MKTIRIILIALLVIYGLGALYGAFMSLANSEKFAEIQGISELANNTKKLILLSGAMLAGMAWLYFSAIALLSVNRHEGYMYAITLGFIELIQAIVIVIAFRVHDFGNASDYFALLKGALLLGLALCAFKKLPNPATNEKKY